MATILCWSEQEAHDQNTQHHWFLRKHPEKSLMSTTTFISWLQTLLAYSPSMHCRAEEMDVCEEESLQFS